MKNFVWLVVLGGILFVTSGCAGVIGAAIYKDQQKAREMGIIE